MVDPAATGVKKTAVSALVARRDHLGPRHAHDVPRAAVVRARHDGLAREDEPRPRRGDPADGDPRHPERLGRPAARLAYDDARRRLRARADPRLDPAALLGRRRSASAFCSGSSRCWVASCRRTSRPSGRSCPSSSARTRRACRRRTARSREERHSRPSSAPHSPERSSRSSGRRTSSTSMRRPTSSRSCSILAFVPRRKPVAAASEHGMLAGLRFLLATSCSRRSLRSSLRSGSSSAGMTAGLPVYAYDEFDGRPWIAGALLRGARRRRARREPGRGRRRAEGRPASARRRSRSSPSRAAVGASVPAAVAGRLRRALRGVVLHAADQRAALRRSHRAHA